MPLNSMTAYGFGEETQDELTYTCEIRTLNARFLEVNVRLPRHLIVLEPETTKSVKEELDRGKVDVFFEVSRTGGGKELPKLDPEAVKHYAKMFDELQGVLEGSLVASFASLQDPDAADFFKLDGVLLSAERADGRGPAAAEQHRKGIMAALAKALENVQQARAKEGESLEKALRELLDTLDSERQQVADKRDSVLERLRESFVSRVKSAVEALRKSGDVSSAELSQERIMMEVAALSDKADIEEEVTRLHSHVEEFRKLLAAGGAVGRKLDFVCQEMHREVNTISNKLVQTDISGHTLNMKQAVERLRQQVQNIE